MESSFFGLPVLGSKMIGELINESEKDIQIELRISSRILRVTRLRTYSN
jgi:hypothetical protein